MEHPALKTPSLDRLMASGVTFTNAYCPYPMCTPSRAGFMTGLLTPQHGVWELGAPLGSGLPTWAHVLRKAGYATSFSGRMHFMGHDMLHGFERRVQPEIGNPIPYTYGDWDKPQQDDHIMVGAVQHAGPTDIPTRAEQYDEAVIGAAVSELDVLVGDEDERPWALGVGLLLPHIPYAVSRPYYDLYDGAEIPMPRVPPDGRNYEQLCPAQLQGCRKWLGMSVDGLSDDQVRMARRCYYGMITRLDELIGRLLVRLDELGVAENTWVLYVSDHGDNMGEHGFWSKLNFLEDSVRVPFILSTPGSGKAGSLCDAPVSLVDWMSTVLALTGEADNAFGDLPGCSLLPLLANPGEARADRVIISDYACDGTRVPMRMVRRGRWKASFAPGLSPTLFDLDDDPNEWNDLGTEPSMIPVVRELEGVARADGWDPEMLRDRIARHKRRLKYISRAEGREG